jgi:hypothetical protein
MLILQQVGLDMLWRLGERSTVVRWLLGHGRLEEALGLCQKRKGRWRAALGPGSVPASEFFSGALGALQATCAPDSDSDSEFGEAADEYLLNQGERVELLHAVYRFLAEWDPQALQADNKGRGSPLSLQAAFPDHMFSPADASRLKRLFGYQTA